MEEEVDVWQQKGLYVAMVWQQEGLYVAARGFICGSKCGSSVAATRVSGHVFSEMGRVAGDGLLRGSSVDGEGVAGCGFEGTCHRDAVACILGQYRGSTVWQLVTIIHVTLTYWLQKIVVDTFPKFRVCGAYLLFILVWLRKMFGYV